jgi:putative transposase
MGYASDLRDDEWEILEPLLEPQQKGRPRKHALRAICNAIRYVQRTGCQWRLLPRDFPPWLVVYMTFWRWRNRSWWEQVMHELRRRVRVPAGRKPDPTLAIIASQSVKTVQKGGNGARTAARKSTAASVI